MHTYDVMTIGYGSSSISITGPSLQDAVERNFADLNKLSSVGNVAGYRLHSVTILAVRDTADAYDRSLNRKKLVSTIVVVADGHDLAHRANDTHDKTTMFYASPRHNAPMPDADIAIEIVRRPQMPTLIV